MPSVKEIKNSLVGRKTEFDGEIFNHYTDTSSLKANQAFGKNSTAIGTDNVAGSKYFTIIGIEGKNITLDSVSGIENAIGEYYSCQISNNYDFIGTIESVDAENSSITVSAVPNVSDFTNNDTLWIPSHPELGTNSFGTAAFCTGYSNIACQVVSSAFGYNNIVSGKYAAAFNRDNKAGYGAFVTGNNNIAKGLYSRAGGQNCVASVMLSIAEGEECKSNATGAFSGGKKCTANGPYSFVYGSNCTSNSTLSFVTGDYNSTGSNGNNSFISGQYNGARHLNCFISGRNNNSASANQAIFGQFCGMNQPNIGINTAATGAYLVVGNGYEEKDAQGKTIQTYQNALEVYSDITHLRTTLDMNGNTLQNVVVNTPTKSTDICNKDYVDKKIGYATSLPTTEEEIANGPEFLVII